jgi:protein phosphatase
MRSLRWTVAAASDRGRVRARNEDFYAYYTPGDPGRAAEYGSLFCVADGVGGHAAGEVASAEAANVLLQEYYFASPRQRPQDRLRAAFRKVAVHVFNLGDAHADFRDMQTTLTALLLRGGRFWIAHVGDAKCFQVRAGAVRQLTRDHSLAAQMRGLGLLRAEEVGRHPGRHVLVRSVGSDPLVRPDMLTGELQSGDVYALVTDGVMDDVSPQELGALVSQPDLEAAVQAAVALANARGGGDNLTVLAVRIAADDATAATQGPAG